MRRYELLNLAYRRGDKLHIDTTDYVKLLTTFTIDAVKQDIGRVGDITTQSILKKNTIQYAHIIARQSGIIAGIEEAVWFYNKYNIFVKQIKKDGDAAKSRDVILELKGREFDLLKTERVGLNLIGRMSGIATLTHELVRKCHPLLVVATRKTHWGNLDKKAVSVGGGGTHRLGLWESILIKENHLYALSQEGVSDPVRGKTTSSSAESMIRTFNGADVIGEALKRAWKKRKKAVFIEIEVENIPDAIKAAQYFIPLMDKDNDIKPCIIMFDNFSPDDVKKTITLLKQKGYYNRILVQASGGITPDNIDAYLNIGLDAVSLGYLTHSPKSFDLSQLIIRKK
ncbi:hypothetical protein MYX07_02570 [Patescibacteria group bacterium AH-259-L07]|nr:hypothetical protein [Patescibacteria group bacterium AH-259-L07]